MGDYTVLSLFRQELTSQVNNLKQSLALLKVEQFSPQVWEEAVKSTQIIWGIARLVEIEPAANLAH